MPLVVAVLADPAQPEVARQRAFGRIQAELEQAQRTAPPTVPNDQRRSVTIMSPDTALSIVTGDNPPQLPSTQRWEPTSP